MRCFVFSKFCSNGINSNVLINKSYMCTLSNDSALSASDYVVVIHRFALITDEITGTLSNKGVHLDNSLAVNQGVCVLSWFKVIFFQTLFYIITGHEKP